MNATQRDQGDPIVRNESSFTRIDFLSHPFRHLPDCLIMRGLGSNSGTSRRQTASSHHAPPVSQNRQTGNRKKAAYRQRVVGNTSGGSIFNAPELWHPPTESGNTRYIVQPPGEDYIHPVSVDEVRERLAHLPEQFASTVEVVQFSRMTRKRSHFPCYGMQWGATVYLYPIEESLVETYTCPPKPAQLIEARMYGGIWAPQSDGNWTLTWTRDSIKDFYLNNVLIHEVGHVNDERNTRSQDRERYANWFAIEYGFRHSRKKISAK